MDVRSDLATQPADVDDAISNTRSMQTIIAEINTGWHITTAALIETGRRLLAAREELDSAPYKVMLKNKLAFTESTAKKLICIAQNPPLSSSSNLNSLPASYPTLYVLSQLPEKLLKAALADGRIHSRMLYREALALKAPKPAAAPAPATGAAPGKPETLLDHWLRSAWEERKALLDHVEDLSARIDPFLRLNEATPDEAAAKLVAVFGSYKAQLLLDSLCVQMAPKGKSKGKTKKLTFKNLEMTRSNGSYSI